MMSETTIKTIMEKFGKQTRYGVSDGDLFITNSKILFRLKNTKPTEALKKCDTITEKQINRAWDLSLSRIFSPLYIDLDAQLSRNTAPSEKCPCCDGQGMRFICAQCNGSGEQTCESCGYDHDCKSCKSSGYVDKSEASENCDSCYGSGLSLMRTTIHFDALSIDFDLRLLRVLNSICKAQLRAPEGWPASIVPAHFKTESSDMDGLVMPLNPNSEKDRAW